MLIDIKQEVKNHMQVNDKQAFIIARALYKGINTGENDVQFSVWGDGAATVGLKRKRGKFLLYIALNDKHEKGIRFPLFDKNVDIQDLADNIQQAIEESVFLEDKDLDTSRKIFQDTESYTSEEYNNNIPDTPAKNIQHKYEAFEHSKDNFKSNEPAFDDVDIDFDKEPYFDNADALSINSDKDPLITTNTEAEITSSDALYQDHIQEYPSKPNLQDAYPDKHIASFQKEDSYNGNYNGFDIADYVTDSTLNGNVLQKSRRVAELISSCDFGPKYPLQEMDRELLVNFLDALIQSLLFSEMTQEEATIQSDSLYIKDLYDFVTRNDLIAIENHFKALPTSHLALAPYRLFAYASIESKSAVMQNTILRLSNYAESDFDSIFDEIYEEMEEANGLEEKAMEDDKEIECNEEMEDIEEIEATEEMEDIEEIEATEEMEDIEKMIDVKDDIFDHNLEANGEANAYYALGKDSSKASIDENETISQLQKQITSRASDFAKVMNDAFITIVDSEPEQAEKLYLVAIAIALKTMNGDAVALAEKMNSDVRDIIMADYEYQLRKKKLQAAL